MSPNVYLCSLLGQVEGDALADFGGQLSEHVSLETTDHDLAQPLVQLVQVGRTPTVPLPASSKVPMRHRMISEAVLADAFVFLYAFPTERYVPRKHLFTASP